MVKTTIRWSGLALMAGALFMSVTIVTISSRLPGQLPTPLVSMLLLVASLLILKHPGIIIVAPRSCTPATRPKRAE